MITMDIENNNEKTTYRKAWTARVKPGLPKFQKTNISEFVQGTVLAQYGPGNCNFEQECSMLAVRDLIAACISYLVHFKPESLDWPTVYNMLYSCLDENHQVPQNCPLEVLFKEADLHAEDCHCKKLYDIALIGGSYHIPATFGKALRLLDDYIFC